MNRVKVLPNMHRGIEYIYLAQLPPDQANMLSAWLSHSHRFTMELEDVVLPDCIAYSTYETWYDAVSFESQFHSQLM